MRATYDPDADAMSIFLKKGEVAKTIRIDEHILLDFDSDGDILSIEVLYVKKRVPGLLKQVKQEKLVVAQ